MTAIALSARVALPAGGTAAIGDVLPGKLFQALVDGSSGAGIQVTAPGKSPVEMEARSPIDDTVDAMPDDPSASAATVDPSGLAAMLSMPLTPATAGTASVSSPSIAASVAAPKAAGATSAPSANMKSLLVASADDRSGDPPAMAGAPTISDVKVETHIAVAAARSVAADVAPAAPSMAAEREPSLPADALQAMAPSTRAVTQAVQMLATNAPAAPAASLDTTPTSVVPARTMTLQLTPANLGTVEVRLRLTGHALDLQLSVSSKETLGVISRDRGHLETALAGQNYDLRSLVIQGSGGATASGDPQAGTPGQASQGQVPQGGRDDTGSRDQGASASGNGASGNGGERRATQQRGNQADDAPRAEAVRAPGASRVGALFV